MALPPVIFEDDLVIAYDKPSGLPVVSERRGHKGDTLVGLAQQRHGPSLVAVHKLDEEASGVVLCAKTKQAQDFLSGQFQSKTVDKEHLALVVCLPAERALNLRPPVRTEEGGIPDHFVVEVGMDVDPEVPGKMQVFRRKGGLPSLSEFRMVERFRTYALVECHPHSGRVHQLRAHLAAAGLPIVNDLLYGEAGHELRLSSLKRGYKGRSEEQPLVRRLALHARALRLRHPATREPLVVEAPLPDDFEVALKYLRRFAPLRDLG